MTDFKNRLGALADKIKNEQPATPIQEVIPVKTGKVESEGESRFNNWIPKSLKKKIKAYAVENDISLKDLNIKALEEYLRNRTNSLSP